MKRFPTPALIVSLLLIATSCGKTFFGGAIQPSSAIQGSITSVQLGNTLNGAGETVEVTFVTFLQSGSSLNVGFCGDQTGQFPLAQTVNVTFNPGPLCATVIVVVVI